jgi:hypothetical protein
MSTSQDAKTCQLFKGMFTCSWRTKKSCSRVLQDINSSRACLHAQKGVHFSNTWLHLLTWTPRCQLVESELMCASRCQRLHSMFRHSHQDVNKARVPVLQQVCSNISITWEPIHVYQRLKSAFTYSALSKLKRRMPSLTHFQTII